MFDSHLPHSPPRTSLSPSSGAGTSAGHLVADPRGERYHSTSPHFQLVPLTDHPPPLPPPPRPASSASGSAPFAFTGSATASTGLSPPTLPPSFATSGFASTSPRSSSSLSIVPKVEPETPAPHPSSQASSMTLTTTTKTPSASLGRPRASVSSSASTADASSSKGSPASPLTNLPSVSAATPCSSAAALSSTTTAPTSTTKVAPVRTPYVPPPPPPPLSNPLDLLARSRNSLSVLIGHGNIDARPSRQFPHGSQKSGACSNCRSAKAKCSQDEPTCERCKGLALDCTYPAFAKRGRKRTMTPNQVLLENCHRDIEQALALLSASSPRSSSGAAFSSNPSPHQTASSSHTPSSVIDSSTTASSSTTGYHHAGQGPSYSGTGPSTSDEDDSSLPGSARELREVLENPLALLAHISSLKVDGDSQATADEESGRLFLPQRQHEVDARGPGPTAEGYFATGLYQLRSDADPAYDPVNLGIISEQTLARFVDFYFAHLHAWTFHLTPSIHTPRFLRDTSPFLTTALSCICATFDPLAQSTIPALFNHLQLINTRIWAEGLKSLEIVQAYMLLIHWTPIANNWGDDRRWGWLGTAIRIATEIKLHKTLNQVTYDFYRSVTPLGTDDDAFERLSEDRSRSWRLVAVAETALGVSTGRFGAVSNLSSVWPGPPTPSNLGPDHPHYNTYALLELTKIYANAMCLSNNITDAEASTNLDIRSSFKSKWSQDIRNWRHQWPHANHYVRMICSHNITILLSISLRFRGPVGPVLEECRTQALETATLAVRWPDDSSKWGSNLSVVVVAYAATLLLRIGASKPGPLSPTVIQLCAAVADNLLQCGATRPNTRTLATLHGTRIRTLLAASIESGHSAQPVPPSYLPTDLTQSSTPMPMRSSSTTTSMFVPFDTSPSAPLDLDMSSLNSTDNLPPELQLFPPVFPAPDPHYASMSSFSCFVQDSSANSAQRSSLNNASSSMNSTHLRTRFNFDPFSPPASSNFPSSILDVPSDPSLATSTSPSLWNLTHPTSASPVDSRSLTEHSHVLWDLFGSPSGDSPSASSGDHSRPSPTASSHAPPSQSSSVPVPPIVPPASRDLPAVKSLFSPSPSALRSQIGMDNPLKRRMNETPRETPNVSEDEDEDDEDEDDDNEDDDGSDDNEEAGEVLPGKGKAKAVHEARSRGRTDVKDGGGSKPNPPAPGARRPRGSRTSSSATFVARPSRGDGGGGPADGSGRKRGASRSTGSRGPADRSSNSTSASTSTSISRSASTSTSTSRFDPAAAFTGSSSNPVSLPLLGPLLDSDTSMLMSMGLGDSDTFGTSHSAPLGTSAPEAEGGGGGGGGGGSEHAMGGAAGHPSSNADDWVHRDALQTDWLNSEPGAWAW
ncbi:hypothetical protein JCM10212_004872 [Sporobolomyces blumeae]